MWVVPFVLGCYHGANPAMGWLFAVALGLQERKTRAVAVAIVPIAIGHLASVALIVTIALFAAAILPQAAVRAAAAVLLIGFGISRLIRARHPRWVGMRVGLGGLSVWGFVMATAHGAGLMLLPFVLPTHAHADRTAMTMPMPMPTQSVDTVGHSVARGLALVGVHTLGYLLVATAVALLVYHWLGLKLLRTAWFNGDLLWAGVLIATGVIAFVT
ncbi:MAG TPA: hypothetical protein VE591_10995 [Candidatus Acidoferrum sp.]|nr:hypothetical protein [Candidatus Acidoferrum sp.]